MNNHLLCAQTLPATIDSVLPTLGIPRIPINLCPSSLNNSAKKSTSNPKSSRSNLKVFLSSASCSIYLPCRTASLSRNSGTLNFVISISLISFTICSNLSTFSS